MGAVEGHGRGDRPTIDYDPTSSTDASYRHEAMASARRSCPVAYSSALNGWVVSGHAEVCEAARSHEVFSSEGGTRPVTPLCDEAEAVLAEGFPFDEVGSLLVTDPPLHTRLRKFVAGVFTPRRVAAMEPRVRTSAEALVEGFAGAGRTELVTSLAYPLPLAMVTELMGLPVEDGPLLHRWSTDKLGLQFGALTPPDQVRAARGFVDMQRYFSAVIEERRRDPGDDIVSGLLTIRVEDERPLRDHELVGQLMGILVGGHETTMNLIASSVVLLMQHRGHWEALCADGGFADACVEESLRVESPSFGTWRTARRDIGLGGTTIRAGERVHLAWGSANRDAAEFPHDPEAFDPGIQREGLNLAFGRGLHFCAGAGLARLEGRVALQTLAIRLPGMRLDLEAPLRFRPSPVQHGPQEVHLVWDGP